MPTLEEIEDFDDIDNLDMDLAEFDPDLQTPVAPAKPKPQVFKSQDTQPDVLEDMFKNMGMNLPKPNLSQQREQAKPKSMQEDMTPEQRKEFNMMQMIYPCYFDISRSTSEGRRLPLTHCIENPLAKTILDACKTLRIPAVLEPEKSHPKDWGNPGRIRVGLKYEHKPTHPHLTSKKKALYAIGDYLQTHKTTLKNVTDLPGPPELMEGGYEPMEVAKVKGFSMNTIVPLHSTLTMKNPQTAGAYMRTPVETQQTQVEHKKMKQKIQRIRA